MLCTLLVPDLFPLRAVRDDAYHGLQLPALERLLSRADSRTLPGQGYDAWLCEAFGITPQPDWPVAALTLIVDCGSESDDAFWLRADPVNLRATREGVRLSDASVLSVRAEEANALIAALNAHFSDDTRRFIAPHPQRWYLRLDARPEIATHTLFEAIGRDIHPLLPAGPQAPHWNRMANEIQMLLHAHAVNEARTSRGEPTINGVWLWGGGHLPRAARGRFHGLWSQDILALGLARAAGLPAAQNVPPGAWLDSAAQDSRGGHRLIVLDQLMLPARHGDLCAWRECLTRLEQEWFSPLLRSLQARRVMRLVIVATGANRSTRFELTPFGLLRVWRGATTLAVHAVAHGS